MNNHDHKSSHHFDFLKEGKDNEFQNALKSMDNLYSDMFKDTTTYDSMFSTFNVQNNPIIEPINQMSKEIFQVQNSQKQVYKKVEIKKQKGNNFYYEQIQESEIIIGEPVYMNEFQSGYFKNKF